MAWPASSSSRTTPTSSSTPARKRARAARRTRQSAARISASFRSGRERAHGPRRGAARHAQAVAARLPPSHAPGGDRAGARRHLARHHRGRVQRPPLPRRARRQRVHPDRHQPVERLLRRPARGRHRGPPRPGPRDRGRADAAEAGAGRHLRGVRDRRRGRALPGGGGRLGAARGGRGVDPGRRPIYGRAAAVRLRGARRAVRVRLLRARGRGRLLLRAGRGAALGGLRPRGARRPAGRGDPRGEQRARPRHRPSRRQADPGSQARPGPGPAALHRDGGRGLRRPRRHLGVRRPERVAPAHARRPAARPAADRDGVDPHRRPRPEWGAGGHRPAARRLLPPAGRRRAAVVKRTLLRLSIPFREPFVTAGGVVTERELLLLLLEGSDGTVGWGEAAPFEPYDGVPLERAIAALSGGGGRRPPQARAAEEIARLDLEARQEGRPLAEPVRDVLPVNMTLAGGPPEEVAERAREGLRAGYACFKLKVGLPDDPDRVAAVREAVGPWPALRVDANRAWSVEQAVSCIRAIEDHDLEFVEQPCRSLDELRAVRSRVSTPIAADESVRTPRALRRALELEACDVVNVKLAGVGGFKAARELLRAARDRGLDAFLSSTLDGPWGIAAALQLAAAEELTLACGLATLELFDSPLARALPAPRAGTLKVPAGPGLGVSIEERALAA